MADALACSRCGSAEIIPRVRVTDRDGDMRYDLQLEIQRRPNALLFKRAERSNLVARVCATCGYAELYAEAPGQLYSAYLQADMGASVSAVEELQATREALFDAHVRLDELEEKLSFVESLLENQAAHRALPKPSTEDGEHQH